MRNRVHIGPALLLLFVSLTFSVSAQRNANKGDRYFDQNLFEEAIPFYEKEVEVGDRDSKDYARKQIAECYRILGEFELAEKTYRKILKKKANQEDPQNYLNYGKSLKSSAKFAEAKEQFQKFIELDPDDPRGPLYLRSCDSAQKWLDETIGQDVINISSLNTETTDFAPLLAKDGKLVFSSSRNGSKEAFISFNAGFKINHLDLYAVDVNLLSGDSIGELERFKEINSPKHEGPATFSADGTEIYFTRTVKGERNTRTNNVINTLQVFYSSIDSTGKWTEPVSAFTFNSVLYSIGQPALSFTEDTIYYMSDKRGGFGGTDIYYSVKDANGTWGEPENMGPEVNTFGHELFPYVSETGVFYFSSDAHPGMGKLDIFSAALKGGKWSNVQNLKPPVNSIGNDFGIVMDGKRPRGFFSSDRFDGAGAEDLYSFSLDAPVGIVIMNNKVYARDAKMYDGLKYQFVNEAGEKMTLSKENGLLELPLKVGKKYSLVVRKSFFTVGTLSLELTEVGGKQTLNVKSDVKQMEVDGYATKSQVVDSVTTKMIPVPGKSYQLKKAGQSNQTSQTDAEGYFNFSSFLDPEVEYSIVWE